MSRITRRGLLRAGLAGTATLGAAGGLWLHQGTGSANLTIEDALKQIAILQAQALSGLGDWHPAQVFEHCAQSIEYSMTGYPENKSPVFRRTIGPLAFSVFAARGSMRHTLNEPIPGAPTLGTEHDIARALERLHHAFVEFDAHTGALAPHFAYGTMSKEDYRAAHIMHLYNHLQEIERSG